MLVALLVIGPRLHDLVKAGILIATTVSAAAVLFQIQRLHAYAATMLVAVAAVLASGSRWELAVIATGLVILTAGLLVLVRFLRRYPAATES